MRRLSHFIAIKPRSARGHPALAALASRLPSFIGGPADAVTMLRTLKIVIVGAGSVGGRIAILFSYLGIACVWLVDPKRYKAESILTHDIEPCDIGKYKAVITGRRCKAINPAMRVFVFTGTADQLPLDAFADADIVVMATDNLEAEIEIGQRCIQTGKPLVQASVHGDTLTAQIRVFSNTNKECPCPACGFGDAEWRMLNEQTRFSCEGFTASQPARESVAPPTMSVGSHCALASALALNQILRIAMQLGSSVFDTSLEFCGFTNRTVTSPLKRNANCPCDHRRHAVTPPPKPLRLISLAELATAAGFTGNVGVVNFTLDGFDWARLGECKCAVPPAVERFIPADQPHAGRCATCRAPVRVTPFFRHRAVSAWTLGNAMAEPLETLSAGAVRCVLADDGQRAVLFRNHST